MREPTEQRTIHDTGTQKLYRFPNGYGASVVNHRFSYGGDAGLWELAVIRWTGDDSFDIVYDTLITGDVVGHLTDDAADKLLDRIESMKHPRDMTTDELVAELAPTMLKEMIETLEAIYWGGDHKTFKGIHQDTWADRADALLRAYGRTRPL